MRLLRILPLLVFAWLVLSPVSGVFAADSEEISSIEFQGAESVSREKLNALIRSRVGQPYDSEAVRDDIKNLGKMARTVEARRATSDKGGIRLIYVLTENPQLRDISVVGNIALSTDRILATVPVKKGEPLDSNAGSKVKEKLIKDYRAAGHTQATVTVQTIDNPDKSVSLQILVNEGERLKVKKVEILGEQSFSESHIRLKLETKGSMLIFDNYFDETSFEEDMQKIARMYIAQGYFDVQVKPGEFKYDMKRKEVTPLIVINEGPRYSVRAVKVVGATYFGPTEVNAPFEALAGQPYESAKMAKGMGALKTLYANEGFLLTEPEESYTFDREHAAVDIAVGVDERERVRVGEVIIQREPAPREDEMGFFNKFYSHMAPPVKDDTIRREVQLKSGDVYRKDQERETVDRLKKLGIFEDVKTHSEPTSDPAVRDMVIEVDEGVTGNLIFGAGYGDATGAFVFGSYNERNLFGQARDLRARVLLGSKSVTGNIGYFDRYWRPDGTSLAVDLYRTAYTRKGYDETETSLAAEFGKPLSEHVKAYLQARVGAASINETEKLGENLDGYSIAAIRGAVTRDTRDSTVWPTAGSISSAAIEGGYAGGTLLKGTGRFAMFKTFRESMIYALNTEADLMPLKASQVGIGERLFLGGTDDLRGFAFRGAGPKDSKDDEVAIGGSTKLLVQNELRYTLLDDLGFGHSPTPLHGLVFADIGMLGQDPLQVDSPRGSVGTGLRVDMNHVNVGVDFALPVLKQSGDQTQFFHFKVSSAF